MTTPISWPLAPDPTSPSPGAPAATYEESAYARQLKHLLPPGALWNLDEGGWLPRALLAIADELARVSERARALIEEADPRTALELLPDWERTLGLPDDCLATIPESISERRMAVTQRLVSGGGQRPQFYVDLAASVGFTITVEEFHPLRAGFRAGDRCSGLDWAHAWEVSVPTSETGGGLAVEFRAGSRAGDRLYGHGSISLECIIRRAAPAHTKVLFRYL